MIMLNGCTFQMTPGYTPTLATWSFLVFTLCSAVTASTSTVRAFDGVTEASLMEHQASNSSRGINSTGLWSRYNLIVKPSVVASTKSVVSVGPSSTPEYRYRPVIDSSDDDDDEQDDTGEDSDDGDDSPEEEDAIEEDDYYATSTTQRSSHRPPQHRKKPKPRPTQILHVIPQPSPIKPLVSPIQPATIKNSKLRKTRKKGHIKLKGLKKLKKYMFPLLLAYKLKFFTLIPLLLGGLVVIVATTGFAGFFFALFAVGVGLKKD